VDGNTATGSGFDLWKRGLKRPKRGRRIPRKTLYKRFSQHCLSHSRLYRCNGNKVRELLATTASYLLQKDDDLSTSNARHMLRRALHVV
jgi:hypothetical protein